MTKDTTKATVSGNVVTLPGVKLLRAKAKRGGDCRRKVVPIDAGKLAEARRVAALFAKVAERLGDPNILPGLGRGELWLMQAGAEVQMEKLDMAAERVKLGMVKP